MAKAGLSIDEIDLVEINEALTPVVLAWQKGPAPPRSRSAPSEAPSRPGPLDATGARLMTTLDHQLRKTGGRCGLQTMREGDGMAKATVLESH
ncbi:hypothetical protein [Streptomyces sp. NBC_01613]|uniref:hypothetical protein n=1 Tax=Streptomyces sp. NBC_01613 TaxID=2975896 RepID=UPI003866AAFB